MKYLLFTIFFIVSFNAVADDSAIDTSNTPQPIATPAIEIPDPFQEVSPTPTPSDEIHNDYQNSGN